MELSFQTKPLHFLKCVFQETYTQEETADTIVPDSFPDIAAIIDAYADPVLRGKDTRDGSLILSVGIKAGILYMPEEENTARCLELYIPCSVRIDHKALTERSQTICGLKIRSVDARMLNSRKAVLRVNLACEIAAYETAEETMYELQDPDHRLQVKGDCYHVEVPLETAERTFTMSEEMEWSGRPALSKVCKMTCRLIPIDQKLVGNKAIFKGALLCKLLYWGQDGILHALRQQFPYSHYCELSQDYDEETVQVTPVITGYDIETDHQDPIQSMQLQVQILAQCVVMGKKELSVISDAYTTEGRFTPQWSAYAIDCCIDRKRDVLPLQAQIQWPLQQIIDTEIYWDEPIIEKKQDQRVITIWASIRVLGYTDQGELLVRSGRGEITETETLALPCSISVSLQPEPDVYASLSGDAIEVRSNVILNTCCTGDQGIMTLTGGTIDEEEEAVSRPSLIVKPMEKGSDLWDIAKKYRTTEDAIKLSNGLEQDHLTEDRLILVPMR